VKKKYMAGLWIPAFFLLLALFLLPVFQLKKFAMMPGDVGDARLNNYFLENIYLFLTGASDSLWHLPFFYPFPYVLGFSDNLFGSAPVYALSRFITGHSDTSYQIWFLTGYVANFSAAYYALRRLGGSIQASTVGALIFAFALPTTAHASHAQLHYRFCLPLAIVYFLEFLDSKIWRAFVVSFAWLVWQFYCGVYMGFFTLLLLGSMSIIYIGYEIIKQKSSPWQLPLAFVARWQAQSSGQKLKLIAGLVFLLFLMILLFYPYFQVSQIYGARRSWAEIEIMLPRPQSYFLSDASLLWSASDSRIFSDIPMRHEHQMFIGLAPLILALWGFLMGSRLRNGQAFTLITGMLGLTLLLTIYAGGFSPWLLLHKLPLASAIRAMTRLDQAILFPVAYLSVIAIDQFKTRFEWGEKAIWVIVAPFLMFEFSATSMATSSKETWRQRLHNIERVLPKDLPKDSIVFIAQENGQFVAAELDAMWVSLKYGLKTLNGYSGLFPSGCSHEYGNDCAELHKRALSYLIFKGDAGNINARYNLMKRIVPVGFIGCDENWKIKPPTITQIAREYTPEEFRHLSYQVGQKYNLNNYWYLEVNIVNSSELSFSAQSSIGKPIRMSWRFLDASGNPKTGWDARRDLPFDIPAKGKLTMRIPIDPQYEVKGGALQVSLVQELVFWAHDIGIPPATIPWN
jgi:hypothetical protein